MNATALQEARRNALFAQQAQQEAEEQAAQESHEGSEEDEEAGDIDEQASGHATPPPDTPDITDEEDELDDSDYSDNDGHVFSLNDEDTEDGRDPRARVLSVLELEDLFMRAAPDLSGKNLALNLGIKYNTHGLSEFTDSTGQPPSKLVVGLVGYPNVGKSSTINSLIGEKKVSVSSTPGKTKHFQTIQLSPTLVLCDCPGLVFPQFATTRADLVCDGVLPIDQLREHTGPTALVVRRIPKEVVEAIYGLSIRSKSIEEGGDGKVTAEDLLIAYASRSYFTFLLIDHAHSLVVARGFTRSGQGNPDEARAARYVLKDYVNAKLLYCHPPPNISEDEFNEDTRRIALQRAEGKKRAPTTRVVKNADTFVPSQEPISSATVQASGHKTQRLDQEFFASNSNSSMAPRPFVQGSLRGGQAFTRSKLYPHQNAVADDGTPVNGRRARIAAVLASAGSEIVPGKKHHKKMKRVKQRSGKGYD